eukprot:TRINITY_DN22204_c0_g1_i1.p1 TRINITY_DN22204_c0_g1~~TRINITY_DN22204_c0_g1_i1.p1  ORF type:complete len:467 (+),score=187.80 TRINITY_DN22204_c0_g1_i1:120-1403(+)
MRGAKRQSIGNHSSLMVGVALGVNFSRSRSAPSNRIGPTTGGSASANGGSNSSSSGNSITAKTARMRSVSSVGTSVPLNSNIFRSKSMGYMSTVHRSSTPKNQVTVGVARARESPRFTPTKAEIGKIRNELVGDKQHFVTQYPVAPSPVKFDVTPSPVKANGRYSAGSMGMSAVGSVTPQRGGSAVECVEAELATLRSELEAERNHSQALAKQARELALQVDREQKTFKLEKSKLQAQIKKMEATAAQAVTDREELRKRTAGEISTLRRELERAERDAAVLKERIEVLESIPPPPPPASVLKSSSKVTWNPCIDYREQSPSMSVESGSSDEKTSSDEEDEEGAVDADLEKDLHEMYREYDTDNIGLLTKLQVSAAYQCMERTFGLAEVPLTFPDTVDTIDFKGFVKIMSALPTRLANETQICGEEEA